MNRALALLLLLIAADARAQQPRVTMDIALPAAPGLEIDRFSLPGLLAASERGLFVALPQHDRDRKQTAVELAAVDRDGAVRFRVALPVDAYRPALESVGVAVVPSGEIGVVVGLSDGDPNPTLLVRLAADGRLKRRSDIAPPHGQQRRKESAASYYELEHYQPTSDNALLLAGGWGSGPYGWWLGKLSLDAKLIFQAGPGTGFPERVASLAARPDGRWLALVQEMRPGGGNVEWHLHDYMANGRRDSNVRFDKLHNGYAGVVLRQGSVIVHEGQLLYLGDRGSIERHLPWPFPHTEAMVAADQGFWAVVGDTSGGDVPTFLVRVDGNGEVRWRTGEIEARSLAATPDGQLAALVHSKDLSKVRLMRFADP